MAKAIILRMVSLKLLAGGFDLVEVYHQGRLVYFKLVVLVEVTNDGK